MTIAIGLRCNDGIIIAADREEGDGYTKNDVGKIQIAFRGINPIGQIAIAGAGSGPYIDEVSKILIDEFCEDDSGLEQLTDKHREYYRDIVMPMAIYGSSAPGYDLIFGSIGGNLPRGIYSTSGLAFNKNDDYQAIGAGKLVAEEWLNRLWDFVPVLYAAKLAAYVIFHVKNSVPGCGSGTDIIILRNNNHNLPERVLPVGVRRWEETFRTTYKTLDRNVFYRAMGLEAPQYLIRTDLDKDAVDKNIETVQREISPLTSQISKEQ
jgi:20S proteasome alpha/beta subunit